MKALGHHILVELSQCNPEVLCSLTKVREYIVEAAKRANTQIKEVALHKFTPQGVSGVVVIAESHLSIHTWPEFQYAAIDIYTCGESANPWKACEFLADAFQARQIVQTVVERGIETPEGWYSHATVSSTFGENSSSVDQGMAEAV
jgi:S-adenosylmethionine decarboxylase